MTDQTAQMTTQIALTTDRIGLSTKRIVFKTYKVALTTNRIALMTLMADHIALKIDRSDCSNDISLPKWLNELHNRNPWIAKSITRLP